MLLIQITCALIVAIFLVVRGLRDPSPRRFYWRIALLAVAAWIAENTVIRAYGFYVYAPGWSLFVDRVPIMIVLIWPVVIQSAMDLARHLLGSGHRWTLLAAAAIVFVDAWLMEPIAVGFGLWKWTEPGLFGVPPIGVLGWAFFAGLVLAVLRANERSGRHPMFDALVLIGPPLGVHALLIAAWWACFRWANHPMPALVGVVLVWALSLVGTTIFVRRRLRQRVPLQDMMLRVPGALFFFALLALIGREQPALVAYGLAFAPPYLALVQRPHRSDPKLA